MITTTKNLWDIEADWRIITINQILNSRGELVMGAGLAKEAKEKYPNLPRDWGRELRNLQKQGKHGHLLYHRPLIGLATKYHFKENSSLYLIKTGLLQLRAFALGCGLKIGLTKLDCGCGNLDWESQVKPLMEMYLPENNFIVSI